MINKCDHDRFEKLIMDFIDPLYGFAKILVKDADRADDLVQETCLRAYRSFHLFMEGTNFKAWLFTILKNIFINEFHQRAKEVTFSQLDGNHDHEMTEIDELFYLTDHAMAEKHIFKSDIDKAFNALPEKLKVVVLLKDIEGFNYKEIANLMDCPLGTVMSRLSRGRTILKSKLRDYKFSETLKAGSP